MKKSRFSTYTHPVLIAFLLILTLFSAAFDQPIHAQVDSPSQPPKKSERSAISFSSQIPSKSDAIKRIVSPAAPHFSAASGIANGDFENGSDGAWTEYSFQGWPIITYKDDLPLTPHSGNWAAWLGGDDDEVSSLTQTVSLPSNTTELSYFHWIASTDECGYDFASVKINNTSLLTLDLCIYEETDQWVRQTVDISAYAGTTVELQFYVDTDSSTSSNYFIDDVSLVSPPPENAGPYLPLMPRTYWPGFFDNFSNTNSGWASGESDRFIYRYLTGEYQIYIKNLDDGFAITPDLVMPANYRIEVDARKVSSGVCSYGLIFGARFTDTSWETYQVLVWPSDGEFYVNKRNLDGTWTELLGWTSHPAINLGNSTNTIRVDRIGISIKIYINDNLVAYGTDDSFTGSGRDAGIRAYSYTDAPVDVRFDNFSAVQP